MEGTHSATLTFHGMSIGNFFSIEQRVLDIPPRILMLPEVNFCPCFGWLHSHLRLFFMLPNPETSNKLICLSFDYAFSTSADEYMETDHCNLLAVFSMPWCYGGSSIFPCSALINASLLLMMHLLSHCIIVLYDSMRLLITF